jgi:type I restriction enzyme R subunit
MSDEKRPHRFAAIATSDRHPTVVAKFEPEEDGFREAAYQSEDDLEKELIRQLETQGYEYLNIRSEEDLILNLRRQLETLNNYAFSGEEWKRFFAASISGANETIIEKTERIQRDHKQVLILDDGTTKNIDLIDKRDIHRNRLQVINQYESEGKRPTRYDVTILVNGLPLVHVELKRRGVQLREAFNQINRYRRESFWAGSGLFEYVQLFVISNGTLTKYYSNTVRRGHLQEVQGLSRQQR